jgi:hypothetical protein
MRERFTESVDGQGQRGAGRVGHAGSSVPTAAVGCGPTAGPVEPPLRFPLIGVEHRDARARPPVGRGVPSDEHHGTEGKP